MTLTPEHIDLAWRVVHALAYLLAGCFLVLCGLLLVKDESATRNQERQTRSKERLHQYAARHAADTLKQAQADQARRLHRNGEKPPVDPYLSNRGER